MGSRTQVPMIRLTLFLTLMAFLAGLLHGRVASILPHVPIEAQTAVLCVLTGFAVALFLRLSEAHDRRKLQASVDRLAQAKARLEELAYSDPLTGVPNRRGFERAYRRLVRQAKRSHSHLCLALVDVDGLKRINDSMGHSEGDKALRTVAKCLSDTLRGSDVVARIGGDEFAAILPNTSSETGRAAMERFKSELKMLTGRPGVPEFRVTVGVACTMDGFEGLYERADSDMYFAKPQRRDVRATVEVPSDAPNTEPTEAA